MDIFIHFVHLAAAMFWVGGQLFLALVQGPSLRKTMSLRERLPLTLEVAKRFKRWSHGALGLLLLTGVWHVRYVFLGSAGSFFSTTYGRLLLLKMGLLVIALGLGVLHDHRWGPALAKLGETTDEASTRAAAKKMVFWARVGMLFSLGVVGCAAALRHTGY